MKKPCYSKKIWSLNLTDGCLFPQCAFVEENGERYIQLVSKEGDIFITPEELQRLFDKALELKWVNESY